MRIIYTFLLCCTSIFTYAQQKTTHTIYFDNDKAAPAASSQDEFNFLLKELIQSDISSIVVKGYTDKNGTSDYNIKLSQQRANAIALQLKEALPKTVTITIEYFGENDLLSEDDAAQQQNRRVQLFIGYTSLPKKIDDVQVEGFYEDVPEQKFDINLDDTVIVTGKGGTYFKITPGSIQTKTGKLAKGKAQIVLKEYYEPSDIILAGMHSNSDKGLLQTAGMFNLMIVQNGDTMSSSTRKKVELRMPVRNTALKNMSVYKLSDESDSAEWKNAMKEFTIINEYWTWPHSERLSGAFYDDHWNYNSWRTGYKYETEYSIHNPIFGYKSKAKKVKFNLEKIDSATVSVHAQVKYRNRGLKRFGLRTLDTTFYSKQMTAQYKTYLSDINWINCDRFYDAGNKTDFFVSTPGFQGMKVVLYFKRINSFMPARFENNKYVVAKIPANEPVIILGFGKKDGDYYLAKQSYFIDKNGLAKLDVKKVTKEKFQTITKGLTFDN